MLDMHDLQQRWATLAISGGIKRDLYASFNQLVDRYNEPWRAYHTLEHISAMLKEFYNHANFVYLIGVPQIVLELAIWYHDAVYDPKRNDNEEQSAEFFKDSPFYSELPLERRERVIALILESKHREYSGQLDSAFFCDLDLSILGQPEMVFDEYERQIRKEYDWVLGSDYVAGRSAVLDSFLKRRWIYQMDIFRKKYERQARRNIRRSLKQLSSRSQS